jgi:hypothetical protein
MRDMAVRMGDAMLRRLLPQATAGACLPQTGELCACKDCNPSTNKCVEYRVSCTGQCLSSSSHCTG